MILLFYLQGLTCGAASVSYSWFYRGFCMVRRPWSCSEPLVSDDKLICTCVQKDAWNSMSTSAKGSSSYTKSPTVSPSKKIVRHLHDEEELIKNANRMKDEAISSLAYTSKRPSLTPTIKPSKLPTTFPTKSLFSINSNNKFVSTACLRIMSQKDPNPPLQFCRQNLQRDSCTVVAHMDNEAPANQSCSAYCQTKGLQCLSAFDSWGCSQQTQRSCDTTLTNYYAAVR